MTPNHGVTKADEPSAEYEWQRPSPRARRGRWLHRASPTQWRWQRPAPSQRCWRRPVRLPTGTLPAGYPRALELARAVRRPASAAKGVQVCERRRWMSKWPSALRHRSDRRQAPSRPRAPAIRPARGNQQALSSAGLFALPVLVPRAGDVPQRRPRSSRQSARRVGHPGLQPSPAACTNARRGLAMHPAVAVQCWNRAAWSSWLCRCASVLRLASGWTKSVGWSDPEKQQGTARVPCRKRPRGTGPELVISRPSRSMPCCHAGVGAAARRGPLQPARPAANCLAQARRWVGNPAAPAGRTG